MRKILRLPFIIYAFIVNVIGLISTKIPSKLRSLLMDVSMCILMLIGVLNYCNQRIQALAHFTWGGPFNVVNIAVVMIFIIIISGIDRKVRIKELKFNPLFWIGWYLCFGVMFATSLIHEVRFTYFSWSIVSLLIYPLIFITWADHYEQFARIVAKNTVIVTYIFALMTLLGTPFAFKDKYVEGFLGIVSNPNGNGMLIAGSFAASLYMLLVSKKKLPYVIPTAFSAVLPIIAGCRSGEIAIFLETVIGLIYYFKCVRNHELNVSVTKFIVCCVVVAILAGAFGYVLNTMDEMDLNAYAVTRDEANENLPNQFLRDLDHMSSGRLVIWIAYVKNATLYGQGNPKVALLDGYNASLSAHNNSLDILYASGVFAFIGYWLWIIACLGFVLKCLFSKGGCRQEYILVIMVFPAYFVEAMLETPMHPFSTNLAVLAYMTIIPIAIRRAK